MHPQRRQLFQTLTLGGTPGRAANLSWCRAEKIALQSERAWRAAGARHLTFFPARDDRSCGTVKVKRITGPGRDEHHRSYRGFNFFAAGDLPVLPAILRGEYHISANGVPQ